MFIPTDMRSPGDRLTTGLARARRASAALFAEICAPSARLAILEAAGKTGRLARLVACEAWTDAALELIALEAPGWTVQRLCRDDGEWLCSLTRFPDLPDWLDDSAEGRHPIAALALLHALLDVRARSAAATLGEAEQLAGVGADCADYR